MRLAVHLHLYYFEMWPYVQKYLANIGSYPYDLYITPVPPPALIKEIRQFHPATTFIKVANRGYDVGPFIYFLKCIKLSNYDLILKIHTKSRKDSTKTYINNYAVTDDIWSDFLFTALLGSRRIFLRNLQHFKRNPQLGMISSRYLISSGANCYEHLAKGIEREMCRLHQTSLVPITFVAGTMFLVRSSLLADFKENYHLNMFAPTNGQVKDGTLAHVLERVFGAYIISKGYLIKGFDRHIGFEYKNQISSLLEFFYSDHNTSSKHRLIKVLKIPIWHGKIR